MAISADEMMPGPGGRMLRTAGVVFLLCLLAAGKALGLGLGGELRLYSALNQPLDAELALFLAPDENSDDVHVRLADRNAYQRLGLPYHDGLPPLSFLVTRNAAGQAVIRIASREPMREPALELLLEVRWAGGRMLRQYALLLDPPPLFTPPPVAEAPVPVSAPAAAAGAPVARPDRSTAAAAYGPVQRGETLSQIAQRLKPEGVGTPQMTVALFEANPHAFIGGNMNRLRWGVTLYLPTPEAMTARSRGAAGRMMAQQQEALQPSAAPAVTVDEPAPQPVLQILAPAAPDAPPGELQQRLTQVRELNEAVEVENEALRLRLLELEQQARNLAQQVLALPPSSAAVPAVPAGEHAVSTPPETAAPPVAVTAAPLLPPRQAWWQDPSWWVVVLAVLLGVGVLLLGTLLWRRSRRWEYRDLAQALRDDAEAKERARQALLEKARRRFR